MTTHENLKMIDSLCKKLGNMDIVARRDLYREIYEGRAIMLADLRIPQACNTLPNFAEEILAAYLEYTTFHVKVWLNYDGIEDAFHNDIRAEQCGKLRLSKGTRDRLKRINRLKLSHVTIELCTMFRSYATLHLGDSKAQDGIFPDFSQLDDSKHKPLITFLIDVCENVRTQYHQPIAGYALTIRDLDTIAAKFRNSNLQRAMLESDLD